MTAPVGIILAGGLGRRMEGADKPLVPLAGRPLIAHVVDRLEPQVAALALNANGDPSRFAFLDLPVCPDSVPGLPGPLAGVLAGLDWAAGQGADCLITVPSDTPFLPGDLVPRLRLAAEGMTAPFALAAAPEDSGLRLHPACGLWPVALREDLRAALGQGTRRLGHWAEAAGARPCMFPDPRAFLNVNTPADLQTAARMIAAG